MKKTIKLIAVLMAIVLLFCSCAVAQGDTDTLSKVESGAQEEISQKEDTEPKKETEKITETEKEDTDVSEKAEETETSEKSKSESGTEKTAGETFEAAVDVEREDGSKETIGSKGLKYTFNSMKVYDNFYESGLEFNAMMLDYDFETGKYYLSDDSKNCYDNNMFILVDMTATYNAPEGGAEEIDVRITNDIIGTYKTYKMPKGWEDEFIALRDQKIWVTDVQVCYLSTVPMPQDGMIPNGNELNLNHLKDGESLNFQIGIRCWAPFVENENVYLQVVGLIPGALDEYDGFYFNLFPNRE